MEFRVKAAKGLEFMARGLFDFSRGRVIFADSQDSAKYKLSNHVSKRAILMLNFSPAVDGLKLFK